MNPAEATISNYLTELRTSLTGLPATECDEIVSEIGGHLRDAVAQEDADVASVVAQLGPPAELAAEYRETLLLERTANTLSPWLLLRGAFRLAKLSVLGLVWFVLAVAGYGMAAALLVTALLKPIFPHNIGMWVGPHVFNFGGFSSDAAGRFQGGAGLFLFTRAPAREVLGWWYIPVALVLGGLLLWGTSKLIRRLARMTRGRRSRPMLRGPHAGVVLCGWALLACAATAILQAAGHAL